MNTQPSPAHSRSLQRPIRRPIQHQVKRQIQRLCLLIALCWLPLLSWADVTAQVDRTSVAVGDAIYLTIRASGSDVGQQPNFDPLNNSFTVGSLSQGTQFTIVNGRSETFQTWTLPIFPRAAGTIEIPSLQVGTKFTQAIELQVGQTAAPTQAQPIDLRIELSRPETWLDTPIIYTAKIFSRSRIDRGTITPPEADGLLVKEMGQNQQYQVTENGLRWMVTERRYLITPTKTGTITIPAITVAAHLSNGAGVFSSSSTPAQVISDSATLTVLERPADYPSNTEWLPLISLTLSDEWSPKPIEFRVGDPVTRTISIRAETIADIRLVAPKLTSNEGIQVYPGESANTTQPGSMANLHLLENTAVYLPNKPGKYTLPAIEVTWFNIDTASTETSILPAQNITILPELGASPTANPTSPNANGTTPEASDAANDEQNNATNVSERSTDWRHHAIWFWLAIGMGLAWLITFGILMTKRHNSGVPSHTKKANQTRQVPLAELQKNLERACEQQDPNDIRTAVLAYASGAAERPINSLDETIAAGNAPELRQALTELQAALYAPDQQQPAIKGTELNATALLTAMLTSDFSQTTTRHQPSPLGRLNPL